MNGQIYCGDTFMRLPSARIAKDDVAVFRNGTELLERASALRDAAASAALAAEREGYARGRQQALDEMRLVLSDAIAELARGFAAENERREHDTAAAAVQVVERLLGQMDDGQIVTGLASEALRKAGAGPMTVTVAPEWVDTVAARLTDVAFVTVEGAPALDRFACRVTSQDGRIIADLATQLAALRERWGLSGKSADG